MTICSSPYTRHNIIIYLLRYSEPHFQSFNHLFIALFWRCIFELWVFLLARFIKLYSLTDVECIWSEQPVDLFFKFRYVTLIKSILQHFGREYHKSLIKILILLLIRQDLRLELHERAAMFILFWTNRLVLKDYPCILVCHTLSFFT